MPFNLSFSYLVCLSNCHSSAQVQHDACSSGDAVLDKSKPISGSRDAAAHMNSSPVHMWFITNQQH
jgi:hypothetical protein